MQIFEVANLKPGRKILHPLFQFNGRKLLAGQTELSTVHIEALQRAGVAQVFMAESARQVLDLVKTNPTFIGIRELHQGTIAPTDFLTPDGTIAIQQNEQIADHHLRNLHDHGIDYVIRRPDPDSKLLRQQLDKLTPLVVPRIEAQIKRTEYLRIPESRDPFVHTITPPEKEEFLPRGAVHLVRSRLLLQLQPVFSQLETGKPANGQALEQIVANLLDLMRQEQRYFPLLAWPTQNHPDYLPDHALSVAVHALTIATQMNYSTEHVREITLAGLLADLGMLAIPKSRRTNPERFSTEDRQLVAQHPIWGIALMEQIPSLSAIPRLAAYQHHERLDSSGYPTGHTAESISDVARIIAVADTYAAMTMPRQYQDTLLPRPALERLAALTEAGLYDPRIVTAFQAALGAYPIGSYVQLSNQQPALVVGTNPQNPERPRIILLRSMDPATSPSPPPILNLNTPPHNLLRILHPIADPHQQNLTP